MEFGLGWDDWLGQEHMHGIPIGCERHLFTIFTLQNNGKAIREWLSDFTVISVHQYKAKLALLTFSHICGRAWNVIALVSSNKTNQLHKGAYLGTLQVSVLVQCGAWSPRIT
jgi:hypothetical protein